MSQDHNPSAINPIKHELSNIKWFIVALWPISSGMLTFDVCLLTVSADIAQTI